VTARNAESYAESVKSQSLDRKFKVVLQQLLKLSENPEGKSSDEILTEAEIKIF
jgi:replicative DNA helicase